jgi:hypothetical protein
MTGPSGVPARLLRSVPVPLERSRSAPQATAPEPFGARRIDSRASLRDQAAPVEARRRLNARAAPDAVSAGPAPRGSQPPSRACDLRDSRRDRYGSPIGP